MKSITETKETLADADPDLSALHRRLSTIGAQLHRTGNRQGMLESILFEARSIAHAEAGSLYLAQNGRLRFVAVQNDPLGHEQITARLLGKEISIDAGSLAGYVAMTGQIMHVSDGDDMPPDGPFRIHREFDWLSGQELPGDSLDLPRGSVRGRPGTVQRRQRTQARCFPRKCYCPPFFGLRHGRHSDKQRSPTRAVRHLMAGHYVAPVRCGRILRRGHQQARSSYRPDLGRRDRSRSLGPAADRCCSIRQSNERCRECLDFRCYRLKPDF